MKIESHADLAKFIEGKAVLHMNSLGKDSAVCLEWLSKFAKPSRIVSIFFKHLAEYPDDDKYIAYQKRRYPNVEFMVMPNAAEITNIGRGIYQSPIEILQDLNKWEYEEFSRSDHADEIMKEMGLDFKCVGFSKYESVARASVFHKKGLVQGHTIFPIGLMTKQNVHDIIKSSGMKLHPSYKVAQTTFDYPSYYKMRRAFLARPDYKKNVYAVFPLLRLDEYRYERLLNGKA